MHRDIVSWLLIRTFAFRAVLATPAAFRKIWPRFFTADYFADKVSLMSGLYQHRYDSVDHRRLGAMPLVVLSIEHPWNTGTPAGSRLDRSYGKIWNALHADLAHLSAICCGTSFYARSPGATDDGF